MTDFLLHFHSPCAQLLQILSVVDVPLSLMYVPAEHVFQRVQSTAFVVVEKVPRMKADEK